MKHILNSGIYCIENKTTHKKYIGQTIDINERWTKHISELNRNSHHNEYLQNAWNKYGKDDFEFFVLELCDKNLLDDKEIYYINFYNTLDREYGYNLKSGGQNHNYYTEETRLKISKSVKQSYKNQELRTKRSIDAINQWSKPEIKSKISGKNNGMYGKHHTEETKLKISNKNKNRIGYNRNRTPVFCVDLNKKFKDATEASHELHIDSSGILKACRGERKTCGGYHWEFIHNRENNIS